MSRVYLSEVGRELTCLICGRNGFSLGLIRVAEMESDDVGHKDKKIAAIECQGCGNVLLFNRNKIEIIE